MIQQAWQSFFCAYLASFQGPNNDDCHKKTCIYCGRIGHWLQDCHEKEIDILNLKKIGILDLRLVSFIN